MPYKKAAGQGDAKQSGSVGAFIRAAKELGLDESGKDFEEVVRRRAKKKPKA